MGCLSLIQQARVAGLTVEAERDRLLIRGPRRLDALAQQLIANKVEVLAEIRRLDIQVASDSCDDGGHAELPPPDPPDLETIDAGTLEPCPLCNSLELWQDGKGNWRCQHCEPPNQKGAALRSLAERIRLRYPRLRIAIAQDEAGGPQVAPVESQVIQPGSPAEGR